MSARSTKKPTEPTLDLAAFRQVPENAGLSLDQLATALSGLLDAGDDPYAAASATGPAAVEPLGAVDDSGDVESDECEITPRSILEAMLFVGSPQNQTLTSKQVAGLMRGVRPAEIDTLVTELNRDYARRNCPYEIVAEGAGYRLRLRQQHARVCEKFHGKARQARLSQAAIEVLAAVAYHAPIAADDISRLRGKPSGHILAQLVRRQLLRLERNEAKPRKIVYSTTPRFLELFGLENLNDLPRSTNLEET